MDTLRTVKTALLNNQIGLFPCDTIWGLIGRMTPEVAQKLCLAKNRSIEQGFIVLIPQHYNLSELCLEPSTQAQTLMDSYWPGPLTIILAKQANIPSEISGKHPGIAVRMPKDGPITKLLNDLQEPLLSTSVNESGTDAHQSKKTVPKQLLDACSFCIEPTENRSQRASTIVSILEDPPKIVRQGSLNVRF